MSNNKSRRPTWHPPGLPNEGKTETIEEIINRLCTNLGLKTRDFLNTHSEHLKHDEACISRRGLEVKKAIEDIKAVMYGILSEKRAVEADYWQIKTKELKRRRLNNEPSSSDDSLS